MFSGDRERQGVTPGGRRWRGVGAAAGAGRARFPLIPVANYLFETDITTMIRKSRPPLKPFESGQLWELEASSVLIGQVGKLLVHYKHYRGKDPRGPTSLSAKTQLEKFLRENKAVLVQQQAGG
jgi:hypothetical protein